MAWETSVQSQVESYQRLKKWYLILLCLTLSIIRYISRVKWRNLGEGVAPSPTLRCSNYWKRSLRGRPRLRSPTLIFLLVLYIYFFLREKLAQEYNFHLIHWEKEKKKTEKKKKKRVPDLCHKVICIDCLLLLLEMANPKLICLFSDKLFFFSILWKYLCQSHSFLLLYLLVSQLSNI